MITAKRETTGAAAKLVMKADRQEASADCEDVVMFAVEVQDAQGRLLPITDNVVKFRVSGTGKLIGVGNGDPTDYESDKGTVRKAFNGYCTYSGTLEGDPIELQRTVEPGVAPPQVEEPTGPRPTVRPTPDGSDPSRIRKRASRPASQWFCTEWSVDDCALLPVDQSQVSARDNWA